MTEITWDRWTDTGKKITPPLELGKITAAFDYIFIILHKLTQHC